MAPTRKKIIGIRFGRLLIVEELPTIISKKGNMQRYFKCLCDCGGITKSSYSSLIAGTSKSCGCLNKEINRSKGRKLKHGVGINDYDGFISNKGVTLKSYQVWSSMLSRCYSKYYLNKRPTYQGCSVCDEWLYYSKFKQWFDKHWDEETMKEWHLDKDILVKGNKIYSPATCCFVSNQINTMFINAFNELENEGVTRNHNRFVARMWRENKYIFTTCHSTFNEAKISYLINKYNYIKEIAEEYKTNTQHNKKVYDAIIEYAYYTLCLTYKY